MNTPRFRLTKAEQAQVTTERLTAVARRLFASQGYARTATEDIVAEAEVTRGALYHHFDSKQALFEAVFINLQVEIGERIEAASAQHDDTWLQIAAGCRAFLRAACETDVRQIILRDGPAVLGVEAWRRADERHATFRLRTALAELNELPDVEPFDVEAVTALLNGALNEAALWIAESADEIASLSRAEQSFMRLIAPLRPIGR